jgi:hypothetical protein
MCTGNRRRRVLPIEPDVADHPDDPSSEGLNENHQRRLLATAQYIDRLLGDVESILAGTESPFAKYLNDLRPEQAQAVGASLVTLRSALVRALASARIALGPPRFSALYTIRTNLGFIEIAIEELRPRYMHGYGAVPPAAGDVLDAIADDLQNTVRRVDRLLEERA